MLLRFTRFGDLRRSTLADAAAKRFRHATQPATGTVRSLCTRSSLIGRKYHPIRSHASAILSLRYGQAGVRQKARKIKNISGGCSRVRQVKSPAMDATTGAVPAAAAMHAARRVAPTIAPPRLRYATDAFCDARRQRRNRCGSGSRGHDCQGQRSNRKDSSHNCNSPGISTPI